MFDESPDSLCELALFQEVFQVVRQNCVAILRGIEVITK